MIRKICISVLIEFPVRLFSMYFSLIDKLVKSTSYLYAQKIYHELGNRLPLTFTHRGGPGCLYSQTRFISGSPAS